jgi:hypothetical protein
MQGLNTLLTLVSPSELELAQEEVLGKREIDAGVAQAAADESPDLVLLGAQECVAGWTLDGARFSRVGQSD